MGRGRAFSPDFVLQRSFISPAGNGCILYCVASGRCTAGRGGEPGGVCFAPCTSWLNSEVPDHKRQEGGGPRPLPHILHAPGTRRQQKGTIADDKTDAMA